MALAEAPKPARLLAGAAFLPCSHEKAELLPCLQHKWRGDISFENLPGRDYFIELAVGLDFLESGLRATQKGSQSKQDQVFSFTINNRL